TILLDYAQHLAIRVVDGMTVHEDRMRENLNLTHGALYSQRALLALVESGRSRDDAYRIVQENAQRAWDEGIEFRNLLAGAGLERFATELRHLQRTEVLEAREPFRAGQKGSSAMPHKRNPIVSERITGIARLLRGYAQAGLEDVALWHERDISHSSVERVALPDATILLDYAHHLATRVVEGMVVNADRMRANIDLTHGALFSQRALLALVESGRSRDDAYRIVQENAQHAWDEGIEFRDLLAEAAPELDLDAIFDPTAFTRHAADIVARLDSLD
ncbi:MAG TPA: lyase family protein, partial [Thermoleophilaceae bacterium]|nr:lyase family protein [Thermoleophilaceae bacterium]